MKQEEIQKYADKLAQEYFPNEHNIWARENIEAQLVSAACMRMAKYVEQELIEKSCEHLDNNFPNIDNVGSRYKEGFIKQFKIAMENKINIAEILKDCPKGMELDCLIYENVTLVQVKEGYDYPIVIETPNGQMLLSKYGGFSKNELAKCIIFPKGKTTWEGFHKPFEDGDIVAFDAYHLQIFIFKDKKENNTLSNCYLMLDVDGDELYLEDGMYYVTRFATEEEKKKLFDAIKAKGYKWNPETKTLEKLIEPKFKVGDKIRHKINNDIYEISAVYDGFYGLVDYTFMLNIKHQDNYELVQNKFDVTTLKPFDKVLVRDKDTDDWIAHLFSHYHKNYDRPYICIGAEGINKYKQCIPYEENKHLLDSSNDCDEQFKTW